MKLFVSDLDGTLLNSKAQLSENSKEILNDLIDNKNIKFTIATARTPATVVPMLKGLHMNLPAVMMNGVLLYDINKEKYLDIKKIDSETVMKICNIFEEEKKDYFAYGIKDNHLVVYYRNLNIYEKEYYEERCERSLKTFIHVEEYNLSMRDTEIINFVVLDKYDRLKKIQDKISNIDGITVNLYDDLYGNENYFMDIYNNNASKANAIKDMRNKYLNAEKIIAFGDNINDIPIFLEADEKYAVANATETLKDISTKVIGNNDDDAVARYISKMVDESI